VTFNVVGLMIGGFALGHFIARFNKWYIMWLFYLVGNIGIFFAAYHFAGLQKLPILSMYFVLFASAMCIGLYTGEGSRKKRNK
jgi:fucose permease